jgi:hypothetical protein
MTDLEMAIFIGFADQQALSEQHPGTAHRSAWPNRHRQGCRA